LFIINTINLIIFQSIKSSKKLIFLLKKLNRGDIKTQSICLYGTVLNSLNTIEKSLKSVYRPDAEIVVVDGGSNDGTYERLIELSKEFNMKVYKLPNSSRGLGRNYAIKKCPENSYASYFDLDDEYNQYYHKSIDWGLSLGLPNPLYHLVSREYAIKKGGWKDLNYAEDVEFMARMGFKFFIPVIFRKPINSINFSNLRNFETIRYSSGSLSNIKRSVRLAIDLPRGNGYKFSEYISLPYFKSKKYLVPSGLLLYTIAKIKGIYRYDKILNNYDIMFKFMVSGLVDPVKEIKAENSDVIFTILEKTAINLNLKWVMQRLNEINLYAYKCLQNNFWVIAGVKEENFLKKYNLSNCKFIGE